MDANNIVTKRLSIIRNFIIVMSFLSIAQAFGQQHDHSTCVTPQETACRATVGNKLQALRSNNNFIQQFEGNFGTSLQDFINWNANEFQSLTSYIENKVCFMNLSLDAIGQELISIISTTQGNYNFSAPRYTEDADMAQISKYRFNTKKEDNNTYNTPKTALCLNAGFEDQNFNNWDLSCGWSTGAFLGAVGTVGTNCPGQHSIFTGGTDLFTGQPRVFSGGASAMLGDYTGSGGRASILRKTFVVAESNPGITYSYMAVLQQPNHNQNDQPFFSAKVFANGQSVACAEYFSFAGDGQPGWIQAGGVTYRQWTSIFVPLENYIGQTITMEFTVGDCAPSAHYAYAYIDVSCDNMEVASFCQGTETVLSAPTIGIQSYLWNTGETTSSISITTPGTYTVQVLPIGSTCPALLVFDATIFPTPTASFSIDNPNLCVGGEVVLTNNSSVTLNGNIQGYSWDFGDGIVTAEGLGPISGALQTTGTYDNPTHQYNSVGAFTIDITVTTTDGCSDNYSLPITVSNAPTATISGNSTVCANTASPEITFSGAVTPGPYTFTYNINGGPDLTAVAPAGSTTVTVPVSTATPGTYTYNLTFVQDPALSGCEQPQTGQAVVVINPLPTATLTSSAVVCQEDEEPILTFTGANGVANTSYQFTYSLNGGANQTMSTATGSATSTLPVSTANAGTFTYVISNVTDVTTGCSQAAVAPGNTATITVNPRPTATIAGQTIVCQNGTQPQITFTGANSTGSYTFTYNVNGGANQTATVNNGTTYSITVPTTTATTLTYTLVSVTDPVTGCTRPVNQSQDVLINPLPTAVVLGSTVVCQFDAEPQVTFAGSLGTSQYMFVYNINGGVQQTVSTTTDTSITVNVPTTVATTYNYNLVSVTDVATGCMTNQSGTVAVTINPTPTATMTGTTTVCQNSTAPQILFTGQNSSSSYAFSYNVNGGPTQTVITAPGTSSAYVTQSTATPGTFIYSMINVLDPVTQCYSTLTDIDTIIVRQLPQATISNPVQACFMSADLPTVVMTGNNGDEPYTFAYNINGTGTQYATSSGNQAIFNIPTNVAGQFIYTITQVTEGSIYACSQAQNLATMVTIHALPIVDAGANFTVCEGEEIVLTGSGAQTYTWNNNVVNAVPFIAMDTTTYTVTGTDHNGCQNTDQITVNVVPTPVITFEGIGLAGCAPLYPVLSNTTTGNFSNCTWYIGNGAVLTGCQGVTTMMDQAGCYDVTLVVTTPEGCLNSMTMPEFICVDAQPIADFVANPSQLSTYNWETVLENQSIGATQFDWDFGDGSNHSSLHSPYHSYPNDEGATYIVTLIATSPNGCVDTIAKPIVVKEELLFYVPNTFTPDNDHYNESFKPVFSTGYDPYNYTLLIFNRWGELIFESHDTNVGWNGKYGADAVQLCQDGTYTWKITVKRRLSDEHKEFVGHVNLLR